MKPEIIKGIIGVVGVSGVIAGSYYGLGKLNTTPNKPAHVENPKSNIRKLITNSGRTVLDDNSNKSLWTIKLSTYNKSFKESGKVNLKTEDEDGLKTWCDEATKKDIDNKNGDDYSLAEQLCTRPTNKEKLLEVNKELAESGDWEAKAQKYKTAENNSIIPGMEDKDKVDAKQIEEWCKKSWDEEILEVNTAYKLIEAWCTKEQIQ